MKILYVTDLHGDKNKYRKSLDIAIEKNISVIVNGGDMLPKLGERHLEQPSFINGFLRDYFSELEKHGITYLAMIGNEIPNLYIMPVYHAMYEKRNNKTWCHSTSYYL